MKKLGNNKELLKALESLRSIRQWGEEVKAEQSYNPEHLHLQHKCNTACLDDKDGLFKTLIIRDHNSVCTPSGLCECGMMNKRYKTLKKDLQRASFDLDAKSRGFLNSIKESRPLLTLKDSLIISGKAGTGKTTIGLGMMFKSLLDPPHQRIEYLTHYQFLSACKSALKSDVDFDLPNRLILDEFMFKTLTDFELEKTFEIINYYQDKKRRIVIITNRTKEELSKALPPNILDRLQTFRWIDHNGQSRRQKKW